jgi:5-methyltetrahydrofolate--homocysteine methyltransferase
MNISEFVSVGENIHCTRIYKIGGKFCKETDDGSFVINYQAPDGIRQLPVPEAFTSAPDWESGRIKHCAVAIWQGVYGSGAEQEAGVDYLLNLARRQEAAGATYLDINVDEFSTDVEERVKLMSWTVETVQKAVSIPMSIDSSNLEILKAGLDICDKSRAKPMVNSVSLERRDAVAIARDAGAVVIASAAGADSLPETPEGRMTNLDAIYQILKDEGFEDSAIHFDPLVFPISTDGQNGVRFLETVTALREKYGREVHIVAGLSNVSFGMPNRKLINQVYTYLAVEAGADGGIVDPMQINIDILNSMDTESEAFKLTKNLLLGQDDFGMEYIMASRDGRLAG